MNRLSHRTVLVLTTLAGSALSALAADPILQEHTASLTTYVYSGSSRVQGVRPLAIQRGVHLDGSMRAGGAFGWAMAGNPFEPGVGSSCGGHSLGGVALETGAYTPTEIDLAFPAQVPWIIGRSYSQVQETSSPAHQDSDGYQGKNWFQMSQPELRLHDADSNPGTKGDADILYLIYGADRYIEFDRTAANADTFRAVNGAAGVIELEAGSPDVYVYYDQQGNRTYFFGDDTSGNVADWQIWKVVDPAGNVAYVGDPTTAATAVSAGYNADGTIGVAYDSTSNDGRRFTYTYSTIDSVSRLAEVSVESKAGGTWGSPTDLREIARVAYDYYQTGDNTHGPNGTLKLVTIRRALSESGTDMSSGVYEERKTYYRYYTQTWADSDGRRGGIGMLKMVVDAEGCRNFDWGEDGAESPEVLDDGFTAASDTSLKAYSSAYFEHSSGSDYRVWKAFFSGECGCSGGNNGTYTFTYGTNGSFSPVSGYDTEWKSRTVVKQPDLVYKTHYFDEVGQQLSSIITDGDPAVSYTDMWATEVVRDSMGCVSEIVTPAANDNDYDHSDGSFTRKSAAGLIRTYERDSGGTSATKGYINGVKFKEGNSGTAAYESWQEFDTRSLEVATGIYVIRPVVDEVRRYHTAGASAGTSANYNATTMSHAWWNGTSTSVEYIALKSVETTSPFWDADNNGPEASTETSRHFRKDGTTAFTVDARGYVTNVRVSDGVTTMSIRDVDIASPVEAFPVGEGASGDFGIANSGTGLQPKTEYEHDRLGRSTFTTMPDGDVTLMHYTRLADGRLVTISVPRYEDLATDKYYGPASYTVTNLAGKPVFSGVIAISSSGTTTGPSGWTDETDSDPILAVTHGSLARMSTSVYNESSGQLEESRSYFDIPASGAGSAGTNYDATTYAYDDMGRTIRVLSPTGTISRTGYDDLGRAYRQFMGTNDNGLPGGSASGTSNMVKVSEITFDGGNDGGNSHVTKRTAFVEDSTTDMRETSFLHDVRGRVIVTLNPQAPHTLVKFDNLGRATSVGQYSSTSGLDISDVPTSLATNRMALSETFYDEKGQVWKTVRHKIDPADGSDDDTLVSLTWYDPDGRVIKTEGEQLTKTVYDRLGRTTHSFVLGAFDDSGYSDADDVVDDLVLEERQTTYEGGSSNNVVMSAVIQRHFDDYGVSENLGALDTNADGNAFKYTAANLEGRIQITSMWYDAWDRVIETVQYGTNGGSDFDRKPSGTFLTVPSRSTTELRTSYTYNEDGTVDQVTDPRAKVTRTLYDDLGRTVTTIQNYINGTSSGATADDVAEYKYNGLGYRIGWHYDTDTDGTVESNTDDPWYLFVYDDEWRILNTYRMLDWAYNASNPVAANAKERFVYHNAGLGGWGESSYIDSVMLRDRDADTAWNAASDGTMEERVYYAQNWRHDVSALVTDDGRMIEWIKYSSYGVPWSLPAADTDSDGDFDTTDSGALSGTYDVRKDVNLDGAVDVLDFLDAFDLNNGLSTLGWSKLGATKWGNRKGYAGYEGDTALAGTKWHVRHRVLESELGRWTKRDPIEHQLSNNVMFYADSRPLHLVDPAGLSPIVMRDDPGLESPNPVPPHPCAANFKKALSDPQVIAAKAAAAAHCPGGTLPAIFLSTCNGGGEFSCGPLSTSIGVCIGDAGSDGGGGCPTASSMVRTILHELTHYKQFCGTGAGYMGIPENGGSCTQWILSHAFGPVKTIREMQAYCEVEYSSMCPPTTWSNADFICRMVEHSGGSYCLCMTLFGYNGGARCVPPPPPPWWSPSIITLAGEIAEM